MRVCAVACAVLRLFCGTRCTVLIGNHRTMAAIALTNHSSNAHIHWVWGQHAAAEAQRVEVLGAPRPRPRHD